MVAPEGCYIVDTMLVWCLMRSGVALCHISVFFLRPASTFSRRLPPSTVAVFFFSRDSWGHLIDKATCFLTFLLAAAGTCSRAHKLQALDSRSSSRRYCLACAPAVASDSCSCCTRSALALSCAWKHGVETQRRRSRGASFRVQSLKPVRYTKTVLMLTRWSLVVDWPPPNSPR